MTHVDFDNNFSNKKVLKIYIIHETRLNVFI